VQRYENTTLISSLILSQIEPKPHHQTEDFNMLSSRIQVNLKPSPMFDFMGRAIANAYSESDNPNGIISLGVAENTLMANELSRFLSQNMKLTTDLFGYGGACPGLPSITTGLLKLYNSEPFYPVLKVLKEHLYVTGGCAALLDQLFWTLCNEGEGVLIGKPAYGGFAADMEGRAKLRPIYVSLKGLDPFSVEAVGRYEEELLKSEKSGIKVRMLILNTPHNPLGQYSHLLLYC
jgi:aspartate/methionine/tyrosine aminotransferase